MKITNAGVGRSALGVALAIGVLLVLSSCVDSTNHRGSTSLSTNNGNAVSADASEGNDDNSVGIPIESSAVKSEYTLSEIFTSGDYKVWLYSDRCSSDLGYDTWVTHVLEFDGADYVCSRFSYGDITLEDIDGLSDDELLQFAKNNAVETKTGSLQFVYKRTSNGKEIDEESIVGLPEEIENTNVRINDSWQPAFSYGQYLAGTEILSEQYFGIRGYGTRKSDRLYTRSKSEISPVINKDELGAPGLIDRDAAN